MTDADANRRELLEQFRRWLRYQAASERYLAHASSLFEEQRRAEARGSDGPPFVTFRD